MQSLPEGGALGASTATRQLLVVAGSGRSGTSLFTGLSGRLGLHIPKPEVKPNRSNPRGFSEPRWAVDFHDELLASLDVTVEDGRPEAWELTDAVAEDASARERLGSWLEQQFAVADRIVVKDPRLAWFIELYRATAGDLGAELRVATMLRHPAAVMRSREVAYGTRSSNTTRVIGWINMMLAIEKRTRDVARATLRYDDLLTDWRGTLEVADESLGLGLLGDPDRVAAADDLVDPALRRSVAQWSELGLSPLTLDLAARVYETYSRLVGVAPDGQDETRRDLDRLAVDFQGFFDECFEVSRSRTGARVRQERRKAARRGRADAAVPASSAATGRRTPFEGLKQITVGVRRRRDGAAGRDA
jgi:hypothetical protein